MATSSSWDYSLTAASVITTAYENLGVIAAGATVATADSTTALTRLNLIAKQHSGPSSGINLQMHSRQRVTLMLAKGQQTYLVGPASTDSRASTALGRTTVSSAYAAGTSLSVTSLTDTTSYPGTTITMTNSDFIGVQLDDGTIAWTTISNAASSPITIGGALGSAASAGNYVWWFTARAQRLIHVEAAVLRDRNFNDTPLNVFRTVQQYDLGVPSKQADGDPTALLIEPLLLNTRVTLDAQPTDVKKQIVLTGWFPQQDYDATANDIAFPQEAYRWLCWELSSELAPAFGVEWTPKMESLLAQARQTFFNLNPENSVLYFRGDGV